MAHEIHENDNFGEVRANGERAWHGLGMAIDPGLTAIDAFPKIGLGWTTELAPLTATLANGTTINVTDSRAHVRCDTGDVLGIVGDGYRPIENMDLAKFADALAGDDATVQVETAGSLFNGRRIFCLVKLPKSIEVVSGDVLNQYVAISNGHGGCAAFSAYPTSVRIVCANTLRASERDLARGLKFWHTGDLDAKVKQARTVLGLAVKETAKFEEKVRALAAAQLSPDQIKFFMEQSWDECFGGLENLEDEDREKMTAKRREAIEAWTVNLENERNTIAGIQGTAWAAFNAVSEWMDHERGRAGSVTDTRVHSNLFGVSSRDKVTVFNAALALAK